MFTLIVDGLGIEMSYKACVELEVTIIRVD
jgi:hypothetical protein